MSADVSEDAAGVEDGTEVWLSGKDASRRLGVNVKTLPALARKRLVTCRAIPGVPVRYLEASVDLLLARSTTSARDLPVEDGGGDAT